MPLPRKVKQKKKEIYFIGEDGITHRISNILGVNVSEFMSIFFDDMGYIHGTERFMKMKHHRSMN